MEQKVDQQMEEKGGEKSKISASCTRNIIWIVIMSIFLMKGVAIGFVVGRYVYRLNEVMEPKVSLLAQKSRDDRFDHRNILDSMKADNIKENLRIFTEYPHGTASDRNNKLGEEILQTLKIEGFDKTETFKYNIYISSPKSPSEISIWDGSKQEKKLVIDAEPPTDVTEVNGTPEELWPYYGYSAAGNVKGEAVYVNYGAQSDFKLLQELGVNISGKIAIMRDGKISRSIIVRKAEELGAIGVIIYPDPDDVVQPGLEYPKGWMMNRYAVPRGTVGRLDGDALSIGYPSKDNYARLDEKKYSGNPTIPCQPVSYGDAYIILRSMWNNSIPLPNEFQGGFNFSYSLSSGRGRHISITVNTVFETKPCLTVCGIIYGDSEPDRYIMLGNHRDAWTFGASDPSSGTAALMEIARALGSYKKNKGWRPQRSIMICSWGGEESGTTGSTEWAEENHKFLTEKVVLYLNVDIAVEGNFTFRLKALDIVADAISEEAKYILAPVDENRTLYDDWLMKSAILKKTFMDKIEKPLVSPLAFGTDYVPMWFFYGTTSADFRYTSNSLDFPNLKHNPHYHTLYDSFGWMSKFVDPKFQYHLTLGKMWIRSALKVADANVIPFDLTAYMKQVEGCFENFENTYKDLLTKQNISLDFAKERLDALISKTEIFHRQIDKMKDLCCNKLRGVNDKIMNFERNFVLDNIVSFNTTPRATHVIYSTTYYNLRKTKFPGISEAIYLASKDPANDWDEVRKQITLVVWCFDTANRSLDLKELAVGS